VLVVDDELIVDEVLPFYLGGTVAASIPHDGDETVRIERAMHHLFR